MNELHIGRILSEDQSWEKDAIHVPIYPVVAASILSPGTRVAFTPGDEFTTVVAAKDEETPAVGVIDPFLEAPVQPGERCWMFLFPGTITQLRHDWTHPFIVEAHSKRYAAATQFMKMAAHELGMSVQQLLEVVGEFIETGEQYCLNVDTPNMWYEAGEEFWQHFQTLTGKKVPAGYEASPFRCAC